MQPTRFLSRVRSRLRTMVLLSGVARLLSVVLLASLCLILSDYVWELPDVARVVVLISGAILLVVFIVRLLLSPLLLSYDDGDLARFVEEKIPSLDGLLFSVLDKVVLNAEQKARLDGLLNEDAVRRMVPAPLLPRLATIAVCMLCISFGSAVLFADLCGVALQRTFFPWIQVEWPRVDTLSVSCSQVVIAEGDPARLDIHRLTGDAETVTVAWSGGSQRFTSTTGQWSVPVFLSRGVHQVHIQAGDSYPVFQELRIVRRPTIQALQMTVTPPSYSGLSQTNYESFTMDVLAGSHIDFVITAQADRLSQDTGVRSFQDIYLKDVDAGTEIELSPVAGGDSDGQYQWTGSYSVLESRTVVLSCIDEDGIHGRENEYFIDVLADKVPLTHIEGLVSNEAVTVAADIPVSLHADDDYGVAVCELFHQSRTEEDIADRAIHMVPIAGRPKQVRSDWTITIADYAKEGDECAFYSQATDANDQTGPGIGRSDTLVVRVVSSAELRRELERLLGEARDRVDQARRKARQVADISTTEDRTAFTTALRELLPPARMADEQLQRIIKRWHVNKLQSEDCAPAEQAREILWNDVLVQLGTVTDIKAVELIDARLLIVYDLLDSMLNAGDLLRDLGRFLDREKRLRKQAGALLVQYIVNPTDTTIQNRLQHVAEDQKQLSQRVLQWEQRIQSHTGVQYKEASTFVQNNPMARRLSNASHLLADSEKAQAAVAVQDAVIADMQALYDMLRGSQPDAEQLAQDLEALAGKQEALAERIEDGQSLRLAKKQQQALEKELSELMKQASEEVKKSLEAAQQAQQQAQKSASQKNRKEAGEQAQTAAHLLKKAANQAQQEADGSQEQEKESPADEKTDVLQTLRTCYDKQQTVVSEIVDLLKQKSLTLAGKRRLQTCAQTEQTIRTLLADKVLPLIEKEVIIRWAVKRVDGTLEQSRVRLASGMCDNDAARLAWRGLRQLGALIAATEELPDPETEQVSGADGGSGGGSSEAPPYPPLAQINIVKMEQEYIADRTMLVRSTTLMAEQDGLLQLLEELSGHTKEGTRPAVLLSRVRLAMKGAARQLAGSDFGTQVQHHHLLAIGGLDRLLREAKYSVPPPSSGEGQEQQQQDDNSTEQSEQNAESEKQGEASSQSAGQQASNAAQGSGGEDGIPTDINDEQRDMLLNLPPALRRKLIEALNQDIPPAGIELYQRYLQELERE